LSSKAESDELLADARLLGEFQRRLGEQLGRKVFALE